LVAIDHYKNTGASSLEIKSVEISPNHENKLFSVVTESEQTGFVAMLIAEDTRPYHTVKIKNNGFFYRGK
jgi:hypothetical protein